jgi:hypothetical protein
MSFELKARINGSNDCAIRHALKQVGADGEVESMRAGFAVSADIEGASAEELNKNLLSALRNFRRRTKVSAEWKSSNGIGETYFDHLLILENFKFFALLYLNDWCEKDRDFVDRLSSISSTTEVRVSDLQDAAKYYGVLRNFGGVAQKGLGAAFTMLESAAQMVTSQSVVAVVSQLAKDFESAYPMEGWKEKVSAASKFLWLRCQSPVVIRDTNAFACLQAASCGTLPQSDYGAYWREWRRQFSKRKAPIRSACTQLVSVKEFLRLTT